MSIISQIFIFSTLLICIFFIMSHEIDVDTFDVTVIPKEAKKMFSLKEWYYCLTENILNISTTQTLSS